MWTECVCDPPQVRHQLSLHQRDLKRMMLKRVLNLPDYCSWLPLALIGHGKKKRRPLPLAAAALPADARALEWDLFCASG